MTTARATNSGTGTRVVARKERWRRFLEPGAAAAPKFMFHIQLQDPAAPVQPPFWPELMRERTAWALAQYEYQCRRAEWLHDDFVPHLSCLTGTEIFGEALGCKVARPDDDMPFALPFVHTARDLAKVRVPKLENSTLAPLFEMADQLCAQAGPAALLKLPDLQSPLGIAALIWDKTELYMALVEDPDAVRALADKTRELLLAFMDEWFRRYGPAFSAHCPDYYMPKGITLSEDEAGAVSAEMFREFYLPDLELLSKRYGGLGMHCCAKARHQWENFRQIPGLRYLNLVDPPSMTPEQYTKPAYSFFAAHAVQCHWGWKPSGEVATWPSQFPADARVVLTVPAKDRKEALHLCDILNDLRG